MKKKFLACMLIMMLTITGCSSKSITQTLFVEKNNKYAFIYELKCKIIGIENSPDCGFQMKKS